MSNQTPNHYDEQYWEYQSRIGRIGGILNKFKFEKHILPTSCVLDFGCGGGYLLHELSCHTKVGFEVNPNARKNAQSLGVDTVSSFDDLLDNTFDVIISNHALEHVPNPYDTLQHLHRVLKVGGLLVLVLPCEQSTDIEFNFNPNDINQHLYSWCPQSLGNLVKLSGFKVEMCSTIRHKWTPDYETAYSTPNYHDQCRQYAIEKGNYQVKCIGRKL
jgi:SAM-dependent methyltransferase